MPHQLDIPQEQLATFCTRHHIQRLAFFGSVLRDDFAPDSDIDVLIEFAPGTRVGLIGLCGMEMELSSLLGRRVDLNTPGFFGDDIRDQVLGSAEVQYEAA